MISNIGLRLEQASAEKRAAYIPFIMGGFPDSELFLNLLETLDQNGADIIEVGIPFSDPLADGPTIQKAGQIALENGATLLKILETLRKKPAQIQSPIVIMSYWNPILQIGIDDFGREASASNISGVIIPDLPPEESGQWTEVAKKHGIDTIFMVAPTTTGSRLESIVKASKGFVYIVSMTGVTGSALLIGQDLLDTIAEVRRLSALPVAVGFGVSNADQAKALSEVADGVIVGSALIGKCLEAPDWMSAVRGVSELSRGIVQSLAKGQEAGHA